MPLGRWLDSDLHIGEEIRFKQKHNRLLESMAKEKGMSRSEIDRLAIIYYKIQKSADNPNKGVSRSHMRRVLHDTLDMTDYELTSFVVTHYENSAKSHVSLENWLKMMTCFVKGTLEDKIAYCFTVFKSTAPTFGHQLVRSTMVNLMKRCFRTEKNTDDEDLAKEFVDMIMKTMDSNRNDRISFEEYRKTVLRNPLYLETFSSVLPSRLALHAFESTFMEDVPTK